MPICPYISILCTHFQHARMKCRADVHTTLTAEGKGMAWNFPLTEREAAVLTMCHTCLRIQVFYKLIFGHNLKFFFARELVIFFF